MDRLIQQEREQDRLAGSMGSLLGQPGDEGYPKPGKTRGSFFWASGAWLPIGLLAITAYLLIQEWWSN